MVSNALSGMTSRKLYRISFYTMNNNTKTLGSKVKKEHNTIFHSSTSSAHSQCVSLVWWRAFCNTQGWQCKE